MNRRDPRPQDPRKQDPRKGIVLVTVLWTIQLISALAMAASTTFRGFAGIIAIDRDRARADALLAAGLEVSAGILTKFDDQPLTERATTISLSTGSVRLRLSDEAGRINVNKAPVKVLASLLRSVGAQDADTLAKSIDIWRLRDQPAGAPQQPSAPAAPNAATAPNVAPQPGTAAPQGDCGCKNKRRHPILYRYSSTCADPRHETGISRRDHSAYDGIRR